MFEFARAHGIKVGALVGTVNHALNQARAGVDVLIAAGGEAGGHCGAVSTMVLVPEVCRALKQHNLSVPVLAAGGIATGEQMAAAMTMGPRVHGVGAFGLLPLRPRPHLPSSAR